MKLEELYNTIGISKKQECAIKLWESLNADIQQGLWNKDLSPEESSYDNILHNAERIEMIASIGRKRQSTITGNANSVGNSHNKGSAHNNGGFNRPNRFGKRKDGRTSDERPSQNHQNGARKFPPDNERKPGSAPPQNRSNGQSKDKANSRKPLSEKQKAIYQEKGLCFICAGSDHVSSKCPKREVVRGSGSRPPGTVPVSSAKIK